MTPEDFVGYEGTLRGPVMKAVLLTRRALGSFTLAQRIDETIAEASDATI